MIRRTPRSTLPVPLFPSRRSSDLVPVAFELEAAVGEQPAQFDAFDEATCLRPLERDFDQVAPQRFGTRCIPGSEEQPGNEQPVGPRERRTRLEVELQEQETPAEKQDRIGIIRNPFPPTIRAEQPVQIPP